jgi:hypothetical protein
MSDHPGAGPPWDVHFTFLICGLLSAICALAAARAFPLGPPREAAARCKLTVQRSRERETENTTL